MVEHRRWDSDKQMWVYPGDESVVAIMSENARLKDMLRLCIEELRMFGAYTVPLRAENFLAELEAQ